MGGRKTRFKMLGCYESGISIETLRLAVTLVLRLSGYTSVEFDKIISVRERKILVPVYAEDGGKNRIAVWCITKASGHELEVLSEVSKLLRRINCPVAVAIPIGLAGSLNRLLRVTSHIFMLDGEGCLWLYSGLRLPADMFVKGGDDYASRIHGACSDKNPYYIA
ncbi:MAG: hypothetical protein QW424_00865 [Candidatus Bathyarchaeia archaeon]